MYDERFQHSSYLIREQPFKLFGAVFQIYDPNGNIAFYSKKAAFRLKEDVRLFVDDQMTQEALTIQARQAIDFSASYDVVDPTRGQRVGSLRRKGMKSLVKDEWLFVDANEREIGTIKEDNVWMAVLRRAMSMVAINLIPQRYQGEVGGTPVCAFYQNINPFMNKITIDFSQDTEGLLDRRLGLAAALLLAAIEGKEQ